MTTMLLRCTAVLTFGLALGATLPAQSTTCRGTNASVSPPQLRCTGTCTGSGSCKDRAGTGSYKGWRICACEQNDPPNSCCGLGIFVSEDTLPEVRTIGDCIGCGYPDRICSKIVAAGVAQALCQTSTVSGH